MFREHLTVVCACAYVFVGGAAAHQASVICHCDVDLGPEGRDAGGRGGAC